jgi:hypothetical protein
MAIIIDLSQGWNEKEMTKLINNLPCSKEDEEMMRQQNKIMSKMESLFE